MTLGDRQARWLACLAFIVVVFAIDVSTPGNIRLGVLYLFPVYFMAYGNGASRATRGIMAAAVICQVTTLQVFDISLSSKVIESIIKTGSILLVYSLSLDVHETHRKLVSLASKDGLTGLLTGRSFTALLEQEIIRQRRYGGVFSLVVLDLNDFKKLNDTRGHPVGDQALVLLGDILRASARQTDAVGRLGGDEFAVLLLHAPDVESGLFCQKLAKTIKKKMATSGFNVTASIGYAAFEEPPLSCLAAMARVDALMYAAKKQGKGYVGSGGGAACLNA